MLGRCKERSGFGIVTCIASGSRLTSVKKGSKESLMWLLEPGWMKSSEKLRSNLSKQNKGTIAFQSKHMERNKKVEINGIINNQSIKKKIIETIMKKIAGSLNRTIKSISFYLRYTEGEPKRYRCLSIHIIVFPVFVSFSYYTYMFFDGKI